MVTTILRKSQISKVNARRLLDDLAAGYSYSVHEAVLVEIIANSLDAGTANIFIDVDPAKGTLTITDDGNGMGPDEFESYHDLAESTKTRGGGIGFAGLGAKLGHTISRRIVTETRSDGYRDASEWLLQGSDLKWKHVRSRNLKQDGTRITLALDKRAARTLTAEFVAGAIERHYGALLDPYLSQLYVWNSIYPRGVTIHLDGRPLPKKPLVDPDQVGRIKEFDILGRGKRLVGRAVFVLSKTDLPEERQGITISTYGKSIRRDTLGIVPRQPERVMGWIEAPDLVECLTLNKQDFIESGLLGKKFQQVRRQLQKAYVEWLGDVGETRERDERQRAPRRLERETAEILRRVPQLRYLYRAQLSQMVNVPDPAADGDGQASMIAESQKTFGVGSDGGGGQGAPGAPGADEGEAAVPDVDGSTPTRRRRRTVGVGPRIERVSDPGRTDISWLEADVLLINTGHPTCRLAERRNLTGYHERFAVYYALCREAPVEPQERFALLGLAMTEWGRSA